MNCPNCSKKMDEVNLLSHYQVKIQVDQCSICGGVWFDEHEHLRADHKEHSKIPKIDEIKFKKNVRLKPRLFCPKDGEELKVMQDKYFSNSVEADFCPQCYGFWFNHGEFGKFQKEREKKLKADNKTKNKKDKELKESLDKMFAIHSQSHIYNSVGHIGRTLSKPVNQIMRDNPYNSVKNNPVSNLARGLYLVFTSLIRIIYSAKK